MTFEDSEFFTFPVVMNVFVNFFKLKIIFSVNNIFSFICIDKSVLAQG